MRKFIIPILVLLFVSCSYKAETDGYAVPEKITIDELDGLYRVMPQCFDMDEAMVFYPGGLVEPSAYLPLASEIANEIKIVVFIQKMPFDLAVLGSKKVEDILYKYSYIKNWYFMGHSLGGAIAASWIHDNPGTFKALILLGAYPIEKKSLKDASLEVLSIRGSEDGLVSPEEFVQSREYLPEKSVFKIIPGGNHANFGTYGIQKKDGKASISSAEQQKIVSEFIKDFLEKVNPRRVY